jgi:hypothetical protein
MKSDELIHAGRAIASRDDVETTVLLLVAGLLVPNPNTATTVDERLITVAIADQVGAAWPIPPDEPRSATG